MSLLFKEADTKEGEFVFAIVETQFIGKEFIKIFDNFSEYFQKISGSLLEIY